ncbi:MAG: HyaD/HybD family hydrogenase maturation endopeptidase [Gammaproteobacteria bacterium]|nr:HyaD/HybD family hydrogenase maturation endopeptidase [Gammaproteobacteria bacterium]
MKNKNTLILGIGNSLLSDEGVGIQALDYLRDRYPDLPDVALLDGGTLSFTLLPYIEDATHLIVVDAAELGAAPGSVELFHGDAMDRFAGRPRRSVHEVSLADLLAISQLTGTLPHNRTLIAVQPQQTDWGSELSGPVAAALPLVARYVVELTRQWADGLHSARSGPMPVPAVPGRG